MRNIKLSILVIMITIFTVVAMSVDLDNLFDAVKHEKNSEVAQTIPPKASENNDSQNKEDTAQQANDKQNQQQAQEESPNTQVEEEETNQGIAEQKENSNDKQREESRPSIEEKPNKPIENDEETAQVFKIDKTTIPDKLSFDEKRKLLSIAKKLSMIDYANIVDTMQNSEEMKSASHIFGILKIRLDNEDYKQLVEILEPYLYIDNIESNISS